MWYNQHMELKRLTTKPDGAPIALSTHMFFFITLVFGIAFVLPPGVFNTFTSPLWSFSASAGVALFWGIGLLATSVLNTLLLLTRSPILASIVGVLGFCLWLYAAFAYFYIGFWLGFLGAAIPNVIFWGWYAVQVAKYRNYLKE